MIYQLDGKTGGVIKAWSSVDEAATALGIMAQGIRRAACNRQYTSHGFRWSWVEPGSRKANAQRRENIRQAKMMAEQLGGDWGDYYEDLAND